MQDSLISVHRGLFSLFMVLWLGREPGSTARVKVELDVPYTAYKAMTVSDYLLHCLNYS